MFEKEELILSFCFCKRCKHLNVKETQENECFVIKICSNGHQCCDVFNLYFQERREEEKRGSMRRRRKVEKHGSMETNKRFQWL